jgi:hypothetical protein
MTFLGKDIMKLLLTDSGIKNATIQDALGDLLGKPIAESGALCIPTAGFNPISFFRSEFVAQCWGVSISSP